MLIGQPKPEAPFAAHLAAAIARRQSERAEQEAVASQDCKQSSAQKEVMQMRLYDKGWAELKRQKIAPMIDPILEEKPDWKEPVINIIFAFVIVLCGLALLALSLPTHTTIERIALAADASFFPHKPASHGE